MARIARIVVPGMPHLITQRGNRGQPTFFCDDDYATYLELMGEWCRENRVQIWAYCLMPNHVHLIAVPKSEEGLARAIGEAHRRYTNAINQRQGWRGYLWQGRFSSFALDKPHLLSAARYVELAPVRAGLVSAPGDYRWSSARAHLKRKDDCLAKVAPLLKIAKSWRRLLATPLSDEELRQLEEHQRTGRILGSDKLQARLEIKLGRILRPQKPGRKPAAKG